MKYKQNERVYFRTKEGVVEGWGKVAGDYDLIVILEPEKSINDYSHIYVSKTQIIDGPDAKLPVVEPEEVDDGL